MLLDVRDLTAGYGEAAVLNQVSFHVKEGEVVSLLGRNGAGKTTTLKALMGLEVQRQGSVVLRGEETISKESYQIARYGVGYCPEDRGIFSGLTVDENMLLPPIVRPGGLPLSEIFALFPNLMERRKSYGNNLSGGEQQMLAIGRILRTGADLLLLDEPSEGLAPTIVTQIARLIRKLRGRGFTVLLIEQNLRFATALADRHYLIDGGRMVDEISNREMDSRGGRVERFLAL